MRRILIIFLPLLIVLIGCNPTKRLQDGEYLVNKVKITGDQVNVGKDDMRNVMKQRPNRKIFVGKFHLHMYNLPNPDKMAKSRRKKDARIHKRNQRRIAKGKDTLDYKLTLAERFRNIVGEPPVILDTSLAKESEDQLSLYLMKKGYFNNKVDFTHKTFDKWPRRKKAKLYYDLTVDKPYKIDSISWDIRDKNIEQIFQSNINESPIRSKDQFDVELLDEERARITRDLRNDGYYFFVKEFIEFEADTVNKDHEVNLKMTIGNPSDVNNDPSDSLNVVDHTSYSIGDVVVSYQLGNNSNLSRDTVLLDDYMFLGSNLFPLNPSVLVRNIFINKGEKYQKNKVEITYQRLLAFELIGLVNIQFIEDPIDLEVLNVQINITFNKRVSMALETTGTTNSGDNLGIKLSTVFKHRNVFRGAEVLNLELQGGIESQNLITDSISTSLWRNLFDLNTFEFGPKLQLTIPKLIVPGPFKFLRTSKSTNQSTIFSAAYNLQTRDDYTRSLLLGSFGYTFRETAKTRLSVNLLEMNVIKIIKSDDFQDRLDEINDRFLSDSYSDHFILASNASFTIKRRQIPGTRISFFAKSNLEGAGNLLRTFANNLDLAVNDEGSFLALEIPFAQYAKLSQDIRLYQAVNNKSSLAFRFFGGLGVPFDNIDVLPFSRSFYGGGANGNRAWRARSLGPGSYSENVINFDKIGDIQLESNLEYRFDLINYLEGAFFIDAGNIWLFNSDSIRVGGQFEGQNFLSEVAIGVGLGVRLNFDYFLVRFDLALQAKDPSQVVGERWFFDPKQEFNAGIDLYNSQLEVGEDLLPYYRPRLNFNLGIGYPF